MFTQPTLYLGTMDGQHKITISGVVFYIESECRKLLTDHLNIIYSSSSDVKHQAVEERMAEMLLDELKEEGKQVISNKEVVHFIERTRNLRQPD